MNRKKKRPPTSAEQAAEFKRIRHHFRMGLVHFLVDYVVKAKEEMDEYEASYLKTRPKP